MVFCQPSLATHVDSWRDSSACPCAVGQVGSGGGIYVFTTLTFGGLGEMAGGVCLGSLTACGGVSSVVEGYGIVPDPSSFY